ncbi:hypothetical protein BJ322DRAFT_1074880, partial [Thelephora terrestris]
MSTRKKHQCRSCQSPVKGHRRGIDGALICPTSFPMPSTSRVAPAPFPRQGNVFRKMSPPIRRGMTIELDEKGDQVLVDGHRYSRVMPGTLDSHVWAWTNASQQTTPEVLEIEDDEDYIEIIDDDDDEVEYEGEIPRLSTRPPSLRSRIMSPFRTPALFSRRHSTARDLGKRRQIEPEREMSIVSAAGDDWPLASLYRLPSDRVRRVVREARKHGLYARVIPKSRVVPVPVGNNLPWIKEEYEEEDSGFFEGFRGGSGSGGGSRAGKERERNRDWKVILGTDEGAVEHLQRVVLSKQEEERQRETRWAISHYHPPSVVSNPPPPPTIPAPMAIVPPPQAGTNVSNILMPMVVGAVAMLYILLKMPD